MVSITVKETSEIIGFIELLSVGKFFSKNLSNYYGENLTEDLKQNLDKVVDFAYSHDEYERTKIEALTKNSYEPFEKFFAEGNLLNSFKNLQNWYCNEVYSPNLEKLKEFTKKMKENLAKANIENEINAMLNFFGYSNENEEYSFYTHMFLSKHAKGESINGIGGVYGFGNGQKEFSISSSEIDQKDWDEKRKEAIKAVIKYFPAPAILHEMTHYYYHKSGYSKKIEQEHTHKFNATNNRILKLDEGYRLPGSNDRQALSLLNEVLATSFQGILQDRLKYQDNREGKLYDSNVLIDKTAKVMMPTVKEYIEKKKQLDDNFILLFLEKTREACKEFSKEKTKENCSCLAY